MPGPSTAPPSSQPLADPTCAPSPSLGQEQAHSEPLPGPATSPPPAPPPPLEPRRRYAASLGDVARLGMANARLTHLDPVVAGQSMSFAVLVAACIQVRACACCRLTRPAGAAMWPAGPPPPRPHACNCSPSLAALSVCLPIPPRLPCSGPVPPHRASPLTPTWA